jgi:HEAT repeat protein
MEADAKNWIRTLVSAARFVVPEGHEATWETTETDTTGRFVARYRAMDAERFQKEKLRYLDALPAGELPLLPEITSHAMGELDLEQGWLVRAEVEESTELAVSEAGLGMSIGMQAKLELAGRERCSPLADDSSWEGPWAALDGQGDPASVARAERDEDRRLLGDATLEDLLAEIEDLLAQGKSDSYEIFSARQKLAALVRLRPETLSVLRAMLAEGRLGDEAAAVVLTAVGAAGTSESELFLVALVEDGQGTPAQRIGAVIALFQLRHSSASTFDAIHGLVLQSGGSSELGNSSLLLLGALAGEPQNAARVERIAALLALKESTGDVSLWLRALGNCGGVEVLEAVSSYLADGDPMLRLSAVEGLRAVPGEHVVELLGTAAREDTDPSVRATAAELLGRRWSDGGEEAVRYVLENDPSGIVRSRALNGVALAANDHEEAMNLLLQAAERDPDSSVREHARELLGGRA